MQIKHQSSKMPLSYNIQDRPNETSSWGKEKLDWWWLILLIITVVTIISLTIIGFYSLPETSSWASDVDYYHTLAKNRRAKMDPLKPFSNEDLLSNIQQISSKAKGLSEYIVKTDIKLSPRDSRLNTSSAGTHGSLHTVIVEFTPRSTKFDAKILLKVNFKDENENTFSRSANKIALALLECLHEMVENVKVLRHSLIFMFDSSAISNNELHPDFLDGQDQSNTTNVFVEINSLQRKGDFLIQTYSDNVWLSEVYLNSFRKGYMCIICDEISKSSGFVTHAGGSIRKESFSRLSILHTYDNGIQNQVENESEYIWINILSLIQTIDNSYQIDRDYEPRDITESIFFDFFGIFLIIYSETDAIIINFVVSFFSLVIMIYSIWLMQRWTAVTPAEIWMQFGIILVIQVLALVVSGGLTIFLSYLYGSYQHLITWIPQYWLLFGIYFCPFIFTMSILQNLYFGWKKFRMLPLRFVIMLFLHVNCFLFVTGILTLTSLSVRTAFVIVSGIAFYTLSLMINIAFKLYRRAYAWIVPILIGQLFPITFVTNLLLIFYTVYIPVSNLSRPPSNIQLLLAISAIGFSMLMFGFMIPIIAIFRKSKTILCGFIVVMFVFLILIFTNMFMA